MKKLFLGSLSVEKYNPLTNVNNIFTFSKIFYGSSEEEAVGWGYKQLKDSYPEYRVSLCSFQEIPQGTLVFLKNCLKEMNI